MTKGVIRVSAERRLYEDCIALYMQEVRETSSGVIRAVADPATMRTIEDGMMCEPFVKISDESARELMDALWRAGVRPSNGEGNIGQIGAIKHHLSDMRAIVGHKLGMDLDD